MERKGNNCKNQQKMAKRNKTEEMNNQEIFQFFFNQYEKSNNIVQKDVEKHQKTEQLKKCQAMTL